MPPVLGPVSPSPTRLKSWLSASGVTEYASTRANAETSGPSSTSSTSTLAPASPKAPRLEAVAERRRGRLPVESPRSHPCPLRDRRPSPRPARRARRRTRALTTTSENEPARAVGMSPSSMSCLGEGLRTLEPGRVGVRARRRSCPAREARRRAPRRAAPQGRSRRGRVLLLSASRTTPSRSSTSTSGTVRAISAMPALPGAATSSRHTRTPGEAPAEGVLPTSSTDDEHLHRAPLAGARAVVMARVYRHHRGASRQRRGPNLQGRPDREDPDPTGPRAPSRRPGGTQPVRLSSRASTRRRRVRPCGVAGRAGRGWRARSHHRRPSSRCGGHRTTTVDDRTPGTGTCGRGPPPPGGSPAAPPRSACRHRAARIEPRAPPS